MFTTLKTEVLLRSRSKGIARLALFLLADNANEHGYFGEEVIPGVGQDCNCTSREMQACLGYLIELDEIEVDDGIMEMPWYGNKYRITLPADPLFPAPKSQTEYRVYQPQTP